MTILISSFNYIGDGRRQTHPEFPRIPKITFLHSLSSIMSLQGKLALITGCSGGIGQATALALAIRGCSIAVHYNSAKGPADDLVAELKKLNGIRAHAFQADLADYDSVRAMHAAVVDILGNPDILFNNAGTTGTVVGKRGNIESVTLDDFEKTWKINTGSSFLLTQLCVPHMVSQKYGRIVFCSSVAAGESNMFSSTRFPHPTSVAQASAASLGHITLPLSLHYMVSYIGSLSGTPKKELPAMPSLQHLSKVRAFTLQTDGSKFILAFADTTMMSNPSDEIRNMIPVGRLGKPHEVASVVETLVTNAYLTNKIMVVDGGITPSAF
ncbi:NAD-binding protein [Mycena venus]|uniref:NAD-binding protein n=1 Tax=Mycena venus TaxID=2733690 RepID=A0A8H7C950_9AGAR|nr:NAD-binding protein [Mycena venus]